MRKKIGVVILLGVITGIAAAGQLMGERLLERIGAEGRIQTVGKVTEQVIVIDSGHGGGDPGKIGVNNAEEKEINLQIAKKVQQLLKEENIKVVMTRESGEGLEDTNVEDLKARVELINQIKPVLTVSIHQNSYQDAGVHGAQVFYFSHSKEGEKAAKIIQESLREIDPENHRKEKANDTYYMLKKTKTPIVIVECGFLSNPKEAEKLCDEEYQMKIAKAVKKGILDYTRGN